MENQNPLPPVDRLPVAHAGACSANDIARCSTDEARSFLLLTEAVAHAVLPLSLLKVGGKMLLHCASAADSPDVRARLRFLCGIDVSLTVVPKEALDDGIVRAYLEIGRAHV